MFTLRPLPMRHEGTEFVILARPDWLSLGGYLLELERQLTASCLALGGTTTQCRAGP